MEETICIARYGKHQTRKCTRLAKWYYRNPQTRELEGPYCGLHSRQFEPAALRSVAVIQQADAADDQAAREGRENTASVKAR